MYGPVLAATANSEDPEQQILRSELLNFMALEARDPAARAELQRQATAFTGFQGDRNADALSSDLYEAALVVAVQDLGKPYAHHLIEVREALDDPKFDNASADALGRASNPELLSLIQELALSERMGSREAYGLIMEATGNPETRTIHWRWLVNNFPAVVEKIPAQWRRRTPAFASTFCSEESIAELQALYAKHGGLTPGYQRAFDQTEEQIQLCLALRDKGEELGMHLTLANAATGPD